MSVTVLIGTGVARTTLVGVDGIAEGAAGLRF